MQRGSGPLGPGVTTGRCFGFLGSLQIAAIVCRTGPCNYHAISDYRFRIHLYDFGLPIAEEGRCRSSYLPMLCLLSTWALGSFSRCQPHKLELGLRQGLRRRVPRFSLTLHFPRWIHHDNSPESRLLLRLLWEDSFFLVLATRDTVLYDRALRDVCLG